MAMAEAADADVPEGMDIPAELARREDRLKAIAAARRRLRRGQRKDRPTSKPNMKPSEPNEKQPRRKANRHEDPSPNRRNRA